MQQIGKTVAGPYNSELIGKVAALTEGIYLVFSGVGLGVGVAGTEVFAVYNEV